MLPTLHAAHGACEHRRSSRAAAGRRFAGTSLAETVTALAIVAVLAGAATPAFSALLGRSRADAAIEQLASAVRFTRHLAVTRRITATLCPSAGERCGRRDTWHEGAMIFLDADADGRRDAGEAVVRRLPPLPEGHRLRWRSFRNRKSLSMRPTGMTDWQNGSMVLCPPDGDARHARQLIVNAQGRTRLATDTDGDGIVENARGRPVSC